VLREMAAASPPLVSQEPRRPRERDHRRRHLLGDGSEVGSYGAEADGDAQEHAARTEPASSTSAGASVQASDEVMRRLSALERRVAHLEAALGEASTDSEQDESSDDAPRPRPRLG